MSVLSRELESYQRALDQYRREADDYNRRADAHNDRARAYTDSLVRDENGQPYVIYFGGGGEHRAGTDSGEGAVRGIFVAGEDGKLIKTSLPPDMDPRNYELTPADGSGNGLMMLRHPGAEKTVQTVSGLVRTGGGADDYGHPIPDSYHRPGTTPQIGPDELRLDGPGTIFNDGPQSFEQSGYGSQWQFTPEQPALDAQPLSNEFLWASLMQSGRPRTYTATREASVQPESPGEWTEEFTLSEPKAPSATLSEMRRMGRPSLARMEGGLISEAIRGRGVR